jgi:hypothetical protein
MCIDVSINLLFLNMPAENHRRLNQSRFDVHTRSQELVSQRISGQQLYNDSKISIRLSPSSLNNSEAVEMEIKRLTESISNPVLRHGFAAAARKALKDELGKVPESSNGRKQHHGNISKNGSIGQKFLKQKTVWTPFGTVQITEGRNGTVYNEAECSWQIDEESWSQQVYVIIQPASWLMKCGAEYALHFITETSLQGLSISISMPRLVSPLYMSVPNPYFSKRC